MRHRPNSDPKFQKALILAGLGSSTKEFLAIFNSGWVFKIEVIKA
jgi:hypothetical protein